jgi:hypothetical protein
MTDINKEATFYLEEMATELEINLDAMNIFLNHMTREASGFDTPAIPLGGHIAGKFRMYENAFYLVMKNIKEIQTAAHAKSVELFTELKNGD